MATEPVVENGRRVVAPDSDVVIDLRVSKTNGQHAAGRPVEMDGTHQLVLADGGHLFREAERLQYRIYRESGYCAESSTESVAELESYRSRSRFHLVVCEGRTPIGTLRTISGRAGTLPISELADRGAVPDDARLLEFSSLAIRPDERGNTTGVAEELYRSAYAEGVRGGYFAIAAIVDPWLLETLSGFYGIPFEPVGPMRRFMGGDVLPCIAEFDRIAPEVARTRSDFWSFTLEAFTPEEIVRYELPIVLGSGGHRHRLTSVPTEAGH